MKLVRKDFVKDAAGFVKVLLLWVICVIMSTLKVCHELEEPDMLFYAILVRRNKNGG